MGKEFLLGQALSITTGRLCCDVSGLYAILDYLEGVKHWTHELPAAADRVREGILVQLPQLRQVAASSVTPANVWAWLERQELHFGQTVKLWPLAQGPRSHSPLETLLAIRPDATIITLELEAESDA